MGWLHLKIRVVNISRRYSSSPERLEIIVGSLTVAFVRRIRS
jgi:hypothetical protein